MRTIDVEYKTNNIRMKEKTKTQSVYEELFVFILKNKWEYTKNNIGSFFIFTKVFWSTLATDVCSHKGRSN